MVGKLLQHLFWFCGRAILHLPFFLSKSEQKVSLHLDKQHRTLLNPLKPLISFYPTLSAISLSSQQLQKCMPTACYYKPFLNYPPSQHPPSLSVSQIFRQFFQLMGKPSVHGKINMQMISTWNSVNYMGTQSFREKTSMFILLPPETKLTRGLFFFIFMFCHDIRNIYNLGCGHGKF